MNDSRFYKMYGAKKAAQMILIDVFLYGCSKHWVGDGMEQEEVGRHLLPFNIKFNPNTFGSWELKEFVGSQKSAQ